MTSSMLTTELGQEQGRLVDIVPGTEVMHDHDSGSLAYNDGAKQAFVLVPYPSDDPHDPLNWSRRWKLMTAFSQLLYLWVLNCSALSLAPLFPLLGEEFHLNQQQLSLLTGLNVITLGFANIFIVPISNIIGRRPTSIVFGVLVILTNIWQALATSHHSLLAARACNGMAAATTETIMVQNIADLFFLHERGSWMAAYFTFYFAGGIIGPIIAGSIGPHHGWRSFFWLFVAMAGFVTLLLVFCYPETKFHRDVKQKAGALASACHSSSAREKRDPVESSDTESVPCDHSCRPGQGSPSRKQYALFAHPERHWLSFVLRDVMAPILVFFNPTVFWSALMLAGPANLLLLFNITESGLFSAPPYNWSPQVVGYSNFAFFAGGIIGVLTAGPLSDWWAQRMTRRNGGIREPEMRLPALIPYCAFYVVSHVVGALGYERLWPWQAIVVCGFGFSGLAVISMPSIAIAYAVDSYKPIAGEIMVVGTVLKIVLGFCLSYWVFDVVARNGWITVFVIQFAIDLIPVALIVPLYIYGKEIRRWTRDSSLHRMESII